MTPYVFVIGVASLSGSKVVADVEIVACNGPEELSVEIDRYQKSLRERGRVPQDTLIVTALAEDAQEHFYCTCTLSGYNQQTPLICPICGKLHRHLRKGA